MTTRLLVAYAMIAAMVGTGLVALWIFVLREKWARRGRRIRSRRDRAARATDRSPEVSPAD